MKNYLEVIAKITDHETFKEIMDDSCGGIVYMDSNKGKYDAVEITALWNSLSASEKDSAGGIVSGVFEFLNVEN